MAHLHLLTTDVSGFDLPATLTSENHVTAVVVPENRANSEKVQSVRKVAAKLGVPVFQHQRGGPLPENLPPAEAAISWMYSQILPAVDLPRYKLGLLNMHGGKIPEFRGANVLQWAIIQGEEEIGVTWHQIVEQVDAGPIWAESTIKMPGHWTAWEVRAELIKEGIRLFPDAWVRWSQRKQPVRIPDLSKGRIWPSRKPRDGYIGVGWEERRVRDMVRALCPPWPPARIDVGGVDRAVIALAPTAGDNTMSYTTAEGRVIYLALGASVD